jgi:D-glycero-D-manno-heptose 1,7-bisphosphate phosphatase
MLFDAAAEYDIDLGRSWMIGDTDADVQAGRAAGVRTVLVETTGSAHKRSTPDEADVVVAELGEAVDAILSIDPARSEDT